MTVCLFGNYISDYPRIQVLKKAFEANGVRVVECHTRKTGIGKFIELWKQHKRLKGEYDIVLIGMGGYTLVWFTKLLSRKPVVFDAFVSQYLTNVEDRQNCSPTSLKAKYYSWLDKNSCSLADLVLLDTNAQIEYFVKQYGLPEQKFVRVFESTDESIFRPVPRSTFHVPRFIVHWHGHIVPFHGLETIMRAAEMLQMNPEIEFRLTTRFDSKHRKVKELVDARKISNVTFYPETSYEGLARSINEADVCLGVFGDNPKARVVIPNKIFEAVACGKPVITGRQEVLKELFTDAENIVLCNPQDPKDLSDKIYELYRDEPRRNIIGSNAYTLFKKRLAGAVIGEGMVRFFEPFLTNQMKSQR